MIVYGISSFESNAMKSKNPNSGIYEAETSRTLDLNGANPSCNQGGMVVVSLEGNGTRKSHRGNGYSAGDKMYTLNTVEVHCVAYGFDQGATRDVGELFLKEQAKTVTNGSCPGHHNGVVVVYEKDRV